MNEISTTATLTCTHSGQTITGTTTKLTSIDTSGLKLASVQALSTTPEAIDLGDVTWNNITRLWVKNQSSVTGEDITLTKSSVDFMVLKPGEAFVFRPDADGTAINAVAATGTPNLQVVAIGPELAA